MAQAGFTPIVTYHSTTGAAVPTAGDLLPGELALNINDMKLYCENSSGVVTLLASAAGASGDVTLAGNNAFTGANTFFNGTGCDVAGYAYRHLQGSCLSAYIKILGSLSRLAQKRQARVGPQADSPKH